MIRISTKSRYGLRSIIDIALHSGRPVTLTEISKRQNIPLKYLGKIMRDLAKAGIVKSYRGPKGGYKLAKNPDDITMKMLIDPVSPIKLSVPCMAGNSSDCPLIDITSCHAQIVWKGLEEKLNEFLNSLVLSDIIAKQGSSELNAEKP